jgi:hypothetical protein
MPVDVTLWAESFSQDEFPSFRCPTCQKGTLTLVPDSLKIVETERSKRAFQDSDDWDPDWTENRFSALLTCSSSKCGELVVVSGDTEVVEEDDEKFRRVWAYHPRPRSIFPAPYIIALPPEVPADVERELQQAFLLFWADLNASANRLRTSLERVMDALKIKRFNKSGKRISIPLAQRIKIFEQEYGTEFSDIFTALRLVGNLGTHADVARTALLSVFEIYEHALNELFGKHKKKIEKLSKKLVKGKGKIK